VLAVIWMAGVSMLTNVILPALHGGTLRADWHRAFEAIERRFVYIADSAFVFDCQKEAKNAQSSLRPLRRSHRRLSRGGGIS
jgi:hypothetical protein